MCSNISWRHLRFLIFFASNPPWHVWHCSAAVITYWNPIEYCFDRCENRGQSGRKWTFNFKTAFVDCVWSVQDTRICSVAKGERSYHVFFQLLQAWKHSSRETERKYTYPVSCYIYIHICVYICGIHIVCKSIQIMWIYIYICTHCHIHIIDLQSINHVIIHDMQRPRISNCWLNIVLKEARVSRFRFQIMSFGGSDSHFPPLLIEILHQFMGIFLEIHYLQGFQTSHVVRRIFPTTTRVAEARHSPALKELQLEGPEGGDPWNASPLPKVPLKMIFLFPRWDILVYQRVRWCTAFYQSNDIAMVPWWKLHCKDEADFWAAERKMTGYAYTRAGELVPCLQKVVSCLTYLG